MARACSLNRHGAALARPPGRHARRHSGPRPLRLVLGLLVVVALVLAATLMPAALAYDADDMDDGGVSGAGSSDTSTDGGDGEGPAASPGYTNPTQHEGIPPGPSAPPYDNPYGPPAGGIPNPGGIPTPGPSGGQGPADHLDDD